MALRGQAASLTSGGGVFFGGWKAQNLRPFSMSISHFATLAGASRGSGAPIAIHFSKSAITASGSLSFLGGIGFTSSVCLIACRRKLLSGSPGTTAGPWSPPLRMASRVSSLRLPRIFSALVEWQE